MLSNMFLNMAGAEEHNPFEVRYLKPKQVRLFRTDPDDARLRLTIAEECSWLDVRLSRAFPFSDPDHYIGISDSSNTEIGQLRSLDGLDAETKQLAQEELDRRYFTPKIQTVYSVKEEYGMVSWDVETDRGRCRFVVRNIRDNTFPLGLDRLLMLDVEGNRYEFGDVNAYGFKAYQVLAKVL